MKVIGITGGVGSGKSELLAYISSHYNCRVLLADEAAHRLQEPGEVCYEKLTALLTAEILNDDGTINRQRMAEKIFSSRDLLEKVNEILHPAVKELILKTIEEERKRDVLDFFFLEAALLIEDGYLAIVDEMWYIFAEERVRRARLKESRHYTDAKINGIMASQLSEEVFRKHCPVVIDNSGSLEAACEQIDRELKKQMR